MPRNYATTPSEEMIKSLGAKRAAAEQHLAEVREHRKGMVSKMEGLEITLERSCNDLGVLYGAITQQDIVAALKDKGFAVRPRDIRIAHAIKRVDNYDIHIKFEADLEAAVKLHVVPDRKIDAEKKEEMDFDSEGNLIEPGRRGRDRGDRDERRRDRDRGERGGEGGHGEAAAKPVEAGAAAGAAAKGEGKGEGKAKKEGKARGAGEAKDGAPAEAGEKAEKAEKSDKGGEKHAKHDKKGKSDKGDGKTEEKVSTSKWGKPPPPAAFELPVRRERKDKPEKKRR